MCLQSKVLENWATELFWFPLNGACELRLVPNCLMALPSP